jgi:hypothetical protein
MKPKLDQLERRNRLKRELFQEFAFVLLLIASVIPILVYRDRLPLWMILTLGFWPIVGAFALSAWRAFKNKGDDL